MGAYARVSSCARRLIWSRRLFPWQNFVSEGSSVHLHIPAQASLFSHEQRCVDDACSRSRLNPPPVPAKALVSHLHVATGSRGFSVFTSALRSVLKQGPSWLSWPQNFLFCFPPSLASCSQACWLARPLPALWLSGAAGAQAGPFLCLPCL